MTKPTNEYLLIYPTKMKCYKYGAEALRSWVNAMNAQGGSLPRHGISKNSHVYLEQKLLESLNVEIYHSCRLKKKTVSWAPVWRVFLPRIW